METVNQIEYNGALYNIQDAEAQKNLVYSQNEIDTGKIWIDGKKIYRKIIDFGSLPNNNLKSVSHGISDIDTIISLNGVTFTEAKTATGLSYTHADTKNEVSLFFEKTTVNIRTFGNKTNYTKTYITIEYTKTTN